MAVPTANVVPLRPDGEDWPTPPQPAAFTGLAGDIVRAIEPHTESDPVAVLVQLLVAFGSVIGRGAHYAVEATRHHSNEFVVLVGPSAKARKGSSWDHVERIFAEVDPVWVGKRTVSGLSSGEGLIWNVRDNPADDDDHSRQGGDKRAIGARGGVCRGLEDDSTRRQHPFTCGAQRLGRQSTANVDQEQPGPCHRRPRLDHRPHHG